MKLSETAQRSIEFQTARLELSRVYTEAYDAISEAESFEARHRTGTDSVVQGLARQAVLDAWNEHANAGRLAREKTVGGWSLRQLMLADAKRKFESRHGCSWPRSGG